MEVRTGMQSERTISNRKREPSADHSSAGGFFEVAKQKGIEYNGNLHRGSRVLREGQPEMQAGDKANKTE
ncbi:MAG: hypothetical protein HXK82_12130, partial [Lachnospiraceae bacterium]|nr:hypothetical protein [Lachnospiraceae bacterium]